jgi:hypothetical protein
LLLSPAKGLLAFSPFLALLLAVPRRSDQRFLALDGALSLACAALLAFYARTDWRAGDGYGPRYLVDLLPALLWLLAPAIAGMRRPLLGAFGVALALAIAIQGVGAFCYPSGKSDRLYYPPEVSRSVIAPSVWRWRNAAFLLEARGGWAPPPKATDWFAEEPPHAAARRPTR